MAKPDKDQALDTSAEDNTGTGDASFSPDAESDGSADFSESADPSATEEVACEAEVIEPDDIEIDPELAAEVDAALEDATDESEIVAQAQAEAAEWQDKYLRLHAEWDTYRRRTNEQREVEKARATEKLVTSLLPVLDDFERTIDYATNNGEEGLLSGVEAVYAKLVSTLEKDGVETISPEGEAFDALEAQAVATVDDDSVPDETVAQVYQKGYRMGSKVLRPAMVTVTTGGSKRESKEEEEEKE